MSDQFKYELKWEQKKGKVVVSYGELVGLELQVDPLALLKLAAAATDNTIDDKMVEMIEAALK